MINRRRFLVSSAIWFVGTTSLTHASLIRDHMPWSPFPLSAPEFERPGPWQFFTADEARAMEAIVDRIIPPDPDSPGGKDAGCATFIDRQLKGPYGSAAGLYRLGPYAKGTKEQGPQSPQTPAELYRKALAALDKYCRANLGGQVLRSAPAGPTGQYAQRSRVRRDQARWRQRAGLLRCVAEGRAGRIFLRSNPWRQSRNGRLEDDWVSRHSLRLS